MIRVANPFLFWIVSSLYSSLSESLFCVAKTKFSIIDDLEDQIAIFCAQIDYALAL